MSGSLFTHRLLDHLHENGFRLGLLKSDEAPLLLGTQMYIQIQCYDTHDHGMTTTLIRTLNNIGRKRNIFKEYWS